MSIWVIGLILWGFGALCAVAFINGAGLKEETPAEVIEGVEA